MSQVSRGSDEEDVSATMLRTPLRNEAPDEHDVDGRTERR
jgi:hypothetical protein